MSGGHFDYMQGRLTDIAQLIKGDVIKFATAGEDNWGCKHDPLPKDILDHMTWVSENLDIMAEAVHDIDWFMSGDYGENTLRTQCTSWKLTQHLRRETPEAICRKEREFIINKLEQMGFVQVRETLERE